MNGAGQIDKVQTARSEVDGDDLEGGTVIKGFEKDSSIPFDGDAVEHTMQWQAGKPTPKGVFLRLRLFIWNGEIFSFQFR